MKYTVYSHTSTGIIVAGQTLKEITDPDTGDSYFEHSFTGDTIAISQYIRRFQKATDEIFDHAVNNGVTSDFILHDEELTDTIPDAIMAIRSLISQLNSVARFSYDDEPVTDFSELEQWENDLIGRIKLLYPSWQF